MASSSKSTTNQRVRSISLPLRSHPITHRIQEELNKLKNYKPSAQSSLSSLEELYICMHEILNLALTRQVLSQHQNEKWVNELLDGSMKLLDICGKAMDLVSQMKEHLGDVQSCLRRRRKGDSSIESSIAKFTSFKKKMKKDAKKLIMALKQMDSEIGNLEILNNLDDHVSTVIGVLREVSATSVPIFQSFLMFLSVPVSKPNQTKWSLVSNLMRKSRVVCEGQVDTGNELERVDAVISTLRKYGSSSKTENLQTLKKRMEALEGRVEVIESGLECIFRRLIRTRASLLNIFSH
ncbi:hypothetical protein LguiA_013906 [Lonicera macranthoides]